MRFLSHILNNFHAISGSFHCHCHQLETTSSDFKPFRVHETTVSYYFYCTYSGFIVYYAEIQRKGSDGIFMDRIGSDLAIWLTQSQSKFQDIIKWQAAHITCWRSQLNKPTQILLLSAPINDKNTEINGICEYRYIQTFDYINGVKHTT